MPQPEFVREAAEQLISVHRAAWQRIMDEQARVLRIRNRNARRRKLRAVEQRIEQVLDQVDAATRRWISQTYPIIYRAGAQIGATQAGGAFTAWTEPHIRAINELAQDLFNDLLTATKFIREDTKRFIRESAKLAAQFTVETEHTAVQGGRLLEGFLREHGIASIIYRDGSRHGLAEYSQMAVRTKSAVAYNFGTLNGGRQAGALFFEVFDGPDCGWTRHDDNEAALGKIVTYEESVTWPVSHPQCRRSFGARPDITNAAQATGTQRSVTPAQTADIRRNDARRAAAQRRRQQRQRRQRRRSRT